MLYTRKIKTYERGLRFVGGEFVAVLGPGRHTFVASPFNHRVDVVSVHGAWLRHPQLDVIVQKPELLNEVDLVEVADTERALVWIDNRFAAVVGPGRYAFWKVLHKVRVEVLDATELRFEHPAKATVLKSVYGQAMLTEYVIEPGTTGLFYVDGTLCESWKPGRYAIWDDVAKIAVRVIDRKDSILEVPGQEIMTRDKVSLRMNAQVSYRIVDPVKSVEAVKDATQALYRDAQLTLRAAVGDRDLDALLTDRDALAAESLTDLRRLAGAYGIEVLSLGIRDLILPGDMKELLNKVTEARKAAEAALITRREEVAGMRSQANAAKILENNPTLMRMRELEVLEKIAQTSNMSIVVGEKGLSERVAHLL